MRGKSPAAAVFALFVATAAKAQLMSDQVPRERTVPRSEEIRQQLEQSRFHFGPVRVRPLFGIRDLGYDNNVFGTTEDHVSDWRSTVSAGADLILPFGRKVYLTGRTNPEYTYYHKLAERRIVGGRYGGSLLMFFNRLTVEGGADTSRMFSTVNSEEDRFAFARTRDSFVKSEIEILRRLSLFGSARQRDQRYPSTGDPATSTLLERLERTDTMITGGVRYRFRSYFDVSAAVEQGKGEFRIASDSDNRMRAAYIGVHYDRPRFFLNVAAGRRSAEPEGPLSTFPRFSGTSGSVYAEYTLSAPLVLDVYARRSIEYGLYSSNPYYFVERGGAGLTVNLGHRIGVRAFSDAGSNEYPVAITGVPARRDQIEAIGGSITYRLYRNTVVAIVATQTDYDSNLDAFDRSIFRVTTVLSLSGASIR